MFLFSMKKKWVSTNVLRINLMLKILVNVLIKHRLIKNKLLIFFFFFYEIKYKLTQRWIWFVDIMHILHSFNYE